LSWFHTSSIQNVRHYPNQVTFGWHMQRKVRLTYFLFFSHQIENIFHVNESLLNKPRVRKKEIHPEWQMRTFAEKPLQRAERVHGAIIMSKYTDLKLEGIRRLHMFASCKFCPLHFAPR
jgi:hypothetical protein